MAICNANGFPGFLTPVYNFRNAHGFPGFLTLVYNFLSKAINYFSHRGERLKYARKKGCLNWVSNLQALGHESDTLKAELRLCGNGRTHYHVRSIQVESICRQQCKFVALEIRFIFDRVENIAGKGENSCYQHFLLFPKYFKKGSSFGPLKFEIVWQEIYEQFILLPQCSHNVVCLTCFLSIRVSLY